MQTLSERMNMKVGAVAGAHVMTNTHLGFSASDTLCLICAELDVDLADVADSDFDSASIILEGFAKSLDESVGYTMSVWFD